MNREKLSVNILFPVLNERLRLQSGIDRTMAYLKKRVDNPCRLTILDNGSDDETPQIGMALAQKYPEVSYPESWQNHPAFRKERKAPVCERNQIQ